MTTTEQQMTKLIEKIGELILEVKLLKNEIRVIYKLPISFFILIVSYYGYFSERLIGDWAFVTLVAIAVQPLGFDATNIIKSFLSYFRKNNSQKAKQNQN